MRILAVLFALLTFPALAQSPGTLNLVGPSTTPGAPLITSVVQLNGPINTALGFKADAASPVFTGNASFQGLSQTVAIAMASNTSNDAAHSGLFLNQSFTGISNSSPVQTKLNSITIFDSVRPVTGNLLDANVLVNYSGTTGNRTAFDATLNQTGATNDLANSFFTALSGTSVGANNNGGTGVTFATSLGHTFGGNLVSHLKAGATNWRQSASLELNNWIEVGASAAIRSFLSIAAVGGVGVQGNLIDAGIWIYSDAINPLIKTGILIGGGGINSYPIDPAGSYISDDITGTVTPTTAYGLHFVGAFTTASISVPGFLVDGTGIVTGASYKAGANQVVGARDTGWTAMTGTPDKATAFATSTVTLAQLAGRVMQMQASLTTHGLFGP